VLAEFVTGGGTYLDPSRVDEAVADRGELGRADCIQWTLGVDLAFTRDPAAAVLVGADPAAPERLRVGLVRVWEPQTSPTFEEKREAEDRLLGDVAELAGYFGARVIVDQLMAPQVESFLARRGVSVHTLHLNAESKTLAFAETRSRIYDGSLELLADERLLRELKGLRTSFVPGRARVLTPRTLSLATFALRDSGNSSLRATSGSVGTSLLGPAADDVFSGLGSLGSGGGLDGFDRF
jgi:hypothetical protein